jgi:hypothetical protein
MSARTRCLEDHGRIQDSRISLQGEAWGNLGRRLFEQWSDGCLRVRTLLSEYLAMHLLHIEAQNLLDDLDERLLG